MLDIKITGFDALQKRIEQIAQTLEEVRAQQKKQPEIDALLTCINTMQTMAERLILAHETLAGGPTLASNEARHMLNAAQMIKQQSSDVPWFEWVFPEEMDKQTFDKAKDGQPYAKARRLVKKKAPVKKAPAKKAKRK